MPDTITVPRWLLERCLDAARELSALKGGNWQTCEHVADLVAVLDPGFPAKFAALRSMLAEQPPATEKGDTNA